MSDSPKTTAGKLQMLSDLVLFEKPQEPCVLIPITLFMDIYAQIATSRPDLAEKLKEAIKGNTHG